MPVYITDFSCLLRVCYVSVIKALTFLCASALWKRSHSVSLQLNERMEAKTLNAMSRVTLSKAL